MVYSIDPGRSRRKNIEEEEEEEEGGESIIWQSKDKEVKVVLKHQKKTFPLDEGL